MNVQTLKTTFRAFSREPEKGGVENGRSTRFHLSLSRSFLETRQSSLSLKMLFGSLINSSLALWEPSLLEIVVLLGIPLVSAERERDRPL